MAGFGDALSAGMSGAGSGAAFGPWGAAATGIAGLLGGLFGGGTPKMDPNQQRLLQQQQGLINQTLAYGNGVPLSDPQEQASLAQMHGLLGAQQRANQGGLFSQWNPTANKGSTADLLANLSANQTGQQGSLDASALMNSLQQRRQALSQATGMISTASGIAAQPYQNFNADLPGLFGNLFQTIAYNKARNGGQHAAAGPTIPSGGPQLTMPARMNNVGTGGYSGGALGSGHYGFSGVPAGAAGFGLDPLQAAG